MSDSFLVRPDKSSICYEFIQGEKDLTLVYLHGLLSCKDGLKSKSLKSIAKKKHLSYLSLDYTGHGKSSGTIQDFRIGRCFQDALDIIHHCVGNSPLLLVGSSLGGWISFLLGVHLPQQVQGILGLAPGVDFTERVWDTLLPPCVQKRLKKGEIIGPSAETLGYCWSYPMFTEAKKYLLLKKGINFKKSVLILQGDEDKAVPFETAFKIKDALTSHDVNVWLLKRVAHGFHTKPDIAIMKDALVFLLKKVENEKNI